MRGARERKTKAPKASSRKPFESEDATLAAPTKKDRKREKGRRGAWKHDEVDENGFEVISLSDGPQHGQTERRGAMGAVNMYSLCEDVFYQWEDLLGSRQALKTRLDAITAVTARARF